MKISSITNLQKQFSLPVNRHAKKETNVAFKGVYAEDIVELGKVQGFSKSKPADFRMSEALLINEIARDYPNQDCFIKRGFRGFPALEYREVPPIVPVFTSTLYKTYNTSIKTNDEEYPTEPLILYPESNLNRFIGLPSYVSLNPSLAYTIKAGYEVHKKLLEKKYQIMDVIGRTDNVEIGGDESLIKKAHKAIEDVEVAVTRYLMECAYAALSDRASAEQIYNSNYPKVQSRLAAKRKLDLTTPVVKQPTLDPKAFKENRFDICEYAMANYPNMEENKARIDELAEYMLENDIELA